MTDWKIDTGGVFQLDQMPSVSQGSVNLYLYSYTRFADPHEGPSRWGSNTVTDNPLQLQGEDRVVNTRENTRRTFALYIDNI